jgi:hypothetical protein
MRFVRCRAGSYRHDIPVSNDNSALLGRVGSPKNEAHRITPQKPNARFRGHPWLLAAFWLSHDLMKKHSPTCVQCFTSTAAGSLEYV